MKIAVALLTCDRYDYTVRTVEALKLHNDIGDWPLFYADDHSQDERIRPYVESQGFKPVLLNNRERMGCSPISDGLLQAVLRETGPEWFVLYLQNDFEAIKPIPWDVADEWFKDPTHMTFRMWCWRKRIRRLRRQHPEREYAGSKVIEKPTAAWPVQISRLGWYADIANGVQREKTLHLRAVKQQPLPISGFIVDPLFRHIGNVTTAPRKTYFSKAPYREMLSEVVVTMTTLPKRVDSCCRAVKAILSGTMKPDRFVLNVAFDPPKELQELPVEIKRVEDIGPATKLLPTLQEYLNRPDVVLVTADDDRLYPEEWLEVLVTAAVEDPECVVCAGGRMIQTGSYRNWRKRRKPTGPLPYLLPLGVYGVAFRPHHFTDQVFDVATMNQLTPHNDDFWYAATRRKEVLAKIVACSRGANVKHRDCLSRQNLRGRNDQAIQMLEVATGWPKGCAWNEKTEAA